jgi:thiol-disulfide isomerase/thioredoxin
MALACSHSTAPTGKARITGKFAGAFSAEQTFTVKVAVPNLVVGVSKQFDEYETKLTEDGSFSLSIPLFNAAYAILSINDNDKNYGAVFLSPDKETKLALSLNETDKIQIKVIKGQGLTPEEIDITNSLFVEFIQKKIDPNSLSELRFDMSPEEYMDYILQWTEKQISIIVGGGENLPENLKQMLNEQLKWYTYINYLFGYEDMVRYLYENQQTGKETDDAVFIPVKPDKTYYSFLRFFDFNNPPCFNNPDYPKIFQQILANSVLNIPRIDSLPLTDWLKEVKTIMAPLVGSDTGLFYDMLALHAYLQQLGESKPLSTGQIAEIKSFFKNPTYTDFIFAENDTLLKQAYSSNADNKKTVESIVSSYKGKVVVIDFWATWCGPCLQAMEDMKPMKAELKNKDVVFVYITDPSSPKDLWEKKKEEIGDEQYYLTDDEIKYIKICFGINSIPTYLIFDANGELKNKFSGFPGVEEMRKMIEKLL